MWTPTKTFFKTLQTIVLLSLPPSPWISAASTFYFLSYLQTHDYGEVAVSNNLLSALCLLKVCLLVR